MPVYYLDMKEEHCPTTLMRTVMRHTAWLSAETPNLQHEWQSCQNMMQKYAAHAVMQGLLLGVGDARKWHENYIGDRRQKLSTGQIFAFSSKAKNALECIFDCLIANDDYQTFMNKISPIVQTIVA